MKYFFSLAILSILLFSCKSENQDSNTEDTAPPMEVVSSKSTADAKDINYPSAPAAVIRNLGLNCDYIDYIFYDLPISISQDNKKAIISNINFISKTVPTSIPNGCKPMGRKSFQVKGEIVLEADIYLNKEAGCFMYIFYENGKKTYANNISSDGINFYFNVFSQAGINK